MSLIRKLKQKNSSIQNFWNYINDNQELISTELFKTSLSNDLSYSKTLEVMVANAHKALGKLANGINIAFPLETIADNNECRNIIVTANGVKKLFKLVEEIVNKAPDTITRFKPVALKPPVDKNRLDKVKAGDVVISFNECLCFMKFINNTDVDFMIVIDNESLRDKRESKHKMIQQCCILMFDALLGEYNFAMHVSKIHFCFRSDIAFDLDSSSAIRLIDVPGHFSKMYNQLNSENTVYN